VLWLSWNGNSQLGALEGTARVPSTVFRPSGGQLSSGVGPKPSRKRWLHLLRKARLANLMSRHTGASAIRRGLSHPWKTAYASGARPGAPSWDWLDQVL
jgi:hypothetical protein